MLLKEVGHSVSPVLPASCLWFRAGLPHHFPFPPWWNSSRQGDMKAEGILCPGNIKAEGLWNMPGAWANPSQRKLDPALFGQGSSEEPQHLVLACSCSPGSCSTWNFLWCCVMGHALYEQTQKDSIHVLCSVSAEPLLWTRGMGIPETPV